MNLQFSDKERKSANKFRTKHWTKCNSKVWYEVYNCSGIGWGIIIHCDACKKSKNITDVSVW